MDIPLPSVLLNAEAVRAYLDGVHDPQLDLSQHEPPQEAYPRSPQQQLIPFKRVIETSAQRISVEDMKCYDTRDVSLGIVADVKSNMARLRSSTPRTLINQPRPLYVLKRRASQSSTVASNNSSKVFIP